MNIGDSHPPPLFFSVPLKPKPSPIWSLSHPDRLGSSGEMPARAFQFEIDQLKQVSARLDLLANEHPIVEEEIISISGHVLSNAVLLEVLLNTRIGLA
jgi:hypothetical protein